MESDRFSFANLKMYYEKGDNNKILSSLFSLKKHLEGVKNVNDVDRKTFEILINLIQYTNSKVMDVSVSILANCCLKSFHREMFKELGGIPHLILIIKTINNDSILCRACRLLGNLANSRNLASALNECGAGFILLKNLETIHTRSSATIIMIFRAIKKLWAIKEHQPKMLPEDLSTSLNNCLHSSDVTLVTRSIETLTLLSGVNSSSSKNGLLMSKDLLSKLVELSQREELTDLTVNCLSTLICYQTVQVWKYLEGSRVAETIISYLQGVNTVNKVVLEAFYKLCTVGAVRNKVKNAGLLPKLMNLSCGGNRDRIILIYYLFQFDISSITILAHDRNFISLLIRNITKNEAVRLLSVVSRLQPPVKELLAEENLNSIIKHKECHGVLRRISQTKEFLSHLIVSGRIWEISKANCLGEGQDHYAEEVLVHLLRTGDKREIENAALAIPFLIKPRHYNLFNILAHNNGIIVILKLLEERPLEERILATVVKLISIFRENIYSTYKFSREFFVDSFAAKEKFSPCRDETENNYGTEETIRGKPFEVSEYSNATDSETVTFVLDCGTCVTLNKNILCENSPVLDAMLNGHFIESNQQKVRMSNCSAEALQYLEELLKNQWDISDLNIETHLELISLTDRFLIPKLNDQLTVSLPMNQSSCVPVLLWSRNSGFSKNNDIIKKKAYEFVFGSSTYLLLAMKNDSLRVSLIKKIWNYLSSCFKDLL